MIVGAGSMRSFVQRCLKNLKQTHVFWSIFETRSTNCRRFYDRNTEHFDDRNWRETEYRMPQCLSTHSTPMTTPHKLKLKPNILFSNFILTFTWTAFFPVAAAEPDPDPLPPDFASLFILVSCTLYRTTIVQYLVSSIFPYDDRSYVNAGNDLSAMKDSWNSKNSSVDDFHFLNFRLTWLVEGMVDYCMNVWTVQWTMIRNMFSPGPCFT